MILVDTSVWIDHFRQGESRLITYLQEGLVCMHPLILGELAVGNLRRRQEVLMSLGKLPRCEEASPEEVLYLIDHFQLHGKGLGIVDVHLLASCRLQRAGFWTKDKRLKAAAKAVGVMI